MSKYIANNYKTFKNLMNVPITITNALNNKFYDDTGKEYYDATSSYCSANFGHRNPYFVDIMKKQIDKINICPRFVDNEYLNEFGETVTRTFTRFINFHNSKEYLQVLPSLNGVDAFETSVKLSRAWGYEKKNIPENKSIQLFLDNNFHGRTISAISVNNDYYQKKFYPKNNNLISINSVDNLENFLNQSFMGDKYSSYVSSITVEPIQVEGGVNILGKEKLQKIKDICEKYNILFICDEIQTGLFRTNKLLCINHYDIKPDIVLLGKSLGAGLLPVSACITRNTIMECIKEGEHGSTFGGNPLQCVVATNVLNYLTNQNYNIEKNNDKLENFFSYCFKTLILKYELQNKIKIENVGLLYGIKIDEKYSAEKLTQVMLNNGILIKSTKKNTIRFTPPFTIDSDKSDLIKKIEISLEEYFIN
jgi:ornithine--oxo-acid transaminase